MKNVIVILLVLLGLPLTPWSAVCLLGEQVSLTPVDDYGKTIPWDDPDFLKPSEIAVTDDGCVFAIMNTPMQVYKFNAKGNFVKKFGPNGRGPADLHAPSGISCLDNKYLVVGEYASDRRISIFDLDGNFIKKIKTPGMILDVIALKDNKIAFLTKTFSNEKITISVYILDITNQKPLLVDAMDDRIRSAKTSRGDYIISEIANEGFLLPTVEGNLMVGFAYRNTFNVFSPEGTKIKTLEFNLKRRAVTGETIDEYKTIIIAAIRRHYPQPEATINAFKSAKNMDKAFSEYLPYYNRIICDEKGNILVVPYKFFYETGRELKFHVFSKEGTYSGDSVFSITEYRVPRLMEILRNRFVFKEDFLFGIFEKDVDDDVVVQVKKMKINKRSAL